MANQGGLIYKTLVIGILILFIGMSIVPSADMIIEKELQTELIIGGPTLGEIGITYEYIFFLFDHEGNDFYLYVVWGDRSNTGWMGPFAADEEVYASHVWEECGYYTIFAVARCEDHYCNASLTVAITDGNYLLDENFSGTFPPEGWSTDWWTQCNSSCGYSEPPCAWLYRGDLNNAYITSKAVDASNYENITLRFTFQTRGNLYCFYIRVRMNETSPWRDYALLDCPIREDLFFYNYEMKFDFGPGGCADAFQVNWTIFWTSYGFREACLDDVIIYYPPLNNPPNTPVIEGKRRFREGEGGKYPYTIYSIDPDGDALMYLINWSGGPADEWVGPFPSGEEITESHSWSSKGSYEITAKAKDTDENEGLTGTLDINIPRSKGFQSSLLLKITQRFFDRITYLIKLFL